MTTENEALELSYFGFPTGSRDNRKLSFDDLPYLWPDVDTAIKALNGDLGKIVTPIMYQLGLKMLNYTEPLEFGTSRIMSGRYTNPLT